MLWRRYKKKCDMNDIECRVIMTLEGERTLADIVHFLHSQQVTCTNQPLCITVLHVHMYHCVSLCTVSLCANQPLCITALHVTVHM